MSETTPSADTPAGEPVPARTPEAEARRRPQRPHFLVRLHRRLHRNPITGLITKIVVTTIGSLVVLAGIIMLVTPGPGLVGIAVGLGILSTEWKWAERWVNSARAKARAAAARAREVDPAVRRRRIALGVSAMLVATIVVVGYLVVFGWPGLAVSSWQQAQNLMPFLPDLPGADRPD